MIHDYQLLDRLGSLPQVSYEGIAFRAIRAGLDPLAPSSRGGRWAPIDSFQVLYTSLERDGAIAELTFVWSQLTPLPRKPALLYEIGITAQRTLKLIESDLVSLGVDMSTYGKIDYELTQNIGAAVNHLECDGLFAPSARWNCENLVLFTRNHSLTDNLHASAPEEIDWQSWARQHGILDQDLKS